MSLLNRICRTIVQRGSFPRPVSENRLDYFRIGVHRQVRSLDPVIPTEQALFAADNAAALLPYRSVRVVTPVRGGRWRISLINPHMPVGPALETYFADSADDAMNCVRALCAGERVARRRG